MSGKLFDRGKGGRQSLSRRDHLNKQQQRIKLGTKAAVRARCFALINALLRRKACLGDQLGCRNHLCVKNAEGRGE